MSNERTVLIGLAVASLAMGSVLSAWLTAPEPPVIAEHVTHLGADYGCAGCNVVLISVDTLRADHLSCQGYARDTSPRLCRFFDQGARAERALSQASWTAPAHASMLTGLYPSRHGVRSGPDIPRLHDVPTLFTRLRAAGWYTAALHGGGYLNPVLDPETVDVHQRITLRRDLWGAMERALADKPDDAPFLVFLHGYDVHAPYGPKVRYYGEVSDDVASKAKKRQYCRYEDLKDGSRRLKKSSVPDDPVIRQDLADLYDAEIREVDDALGRLFDRMERMGMLEDTIVVLTSDHGEELFDHGSCDHVRTVFDEILHVPLMIRAPHGAPVRIDAPVPASITVTPTLLALLGLPADPTLDGRPLTEDPPPRFVSEARFFHDGRHEARYAVHEGATKWVYDALKGDAVRFDLATDPGERTPIAADAAALAAELAPHTEAALLTPEALDERTRQQLRALGYSD